MAGGVPILVHNTNCGPENLTFATRAEAKAAAYARAGIEPGATPDSVWTVGDDVTQRGMPGYRFDSNPGAHGIYEQFETESGSRVIAEHTNDPNAPFSHFHAGQPKTDPTRDGVNFGWDMTSPFERYSPVGGSHHFYYQSDE
ncbi:HNH/endonuclease VII fold putative polymorphic toxin [Streptacidiphilus monticola]|uniref:HNH/endonuclease VII fold putative polymorphic toxin n=1 Tax=Streptacidiphilus monticola TaxID=2161674 RepID=A0ABW1G2R1_9ACTN